MPDAKKLLALDVFTYAVGKIKTYIADQIGDIEFPEVTMEKLTTADTGYFSTYQLKVGNTAVGDKINIPKDYVLKSVSLNTVATADTPVTGYTVGQKYFDFVFNTKDQTETDTHTYLLAQDLVDVFTGGTGIEVTSANVINLLAQNATSASDANAPDVGGVTKADYVAFKGSLASITAPTETAPTADSGKNETINTKTHTFTTATAGGTAGSSVTVTEYYATYGEAVAADTANNITAKSGLMTGGEKANLAALQSAKSGYDAIVTLLGADVELATTSDIDALFEDEEEQSNG